MKSLANAVILGGIVVLIFFGLSLGALAIQQRRSASGVLKAAATLAITSDIRSPITRDGMTFLVRPKNLDRLARSFQLQGWELKEKTGYGMLFENEESRMTIRLEDLTSHYRVGDITVQPLGDGSK